MNDNRLTPRGSINSPILIVGDSLPANEVTVDRLNEILDRRGVTYNSIIIPLKYYINDYLIKNHNCKLPHEDKNDIFRYINAIDYNCDKRGLNPQSLEGQTILFKLKEEISSKERSFRIIICLGDFAYFAVRAVLNKYNKNEQKKYPQNGTKYSIERLGDYFRRNFKKNKYNCIDTLILPILHNSINLSFQLSNEFIPIEERANYISTMQYIAEEISKFIILDETCKNYLLRIK